MNKITGMREIMKDIEFLNNLNILYVEDDLDGREIIGTALKKIFNNVYLVSDGLEAIELYKELKSSKIIPDVIVSDIDMPNLGGIELLSQIREDNPDIPFLLTTAYSTTQYLVDSISEGVSGYVLKPINFSELIEKIRILCRKRNKLELIKKQKNEVELYLKIIDNIALVSKTDMNGNITYVNNIFCDISKYNRDEIIGNSHGITRHPDEKDLFFDTIFQTIKAGETWSGEVTNRAKDGSSYCAELIIIPIFDKLGNDIVEYIDIGFLTANENEELKDDTKLKEIIIKQNKAILELRD